MSARASADLLAGGAARAAASSPLSAGAAAARAPAPSASGPASSQGLASSAPARPSSTAVAASSQSRASVGKGDGVSPAAEQSPADAPEVARLAQDLDAVSISGAGAPASLPPSGGDGGAPAASLSSPPQALAGAPTPASSPPAAADGEAPAPASSSPAAASAGAPAPASSSLPSPPGAVRTSAVGVAEQTPPPSPLASYPSIRVPPADGSPIVFLERAVGGRLGKDGVLAHLAPWNAMIYPDLPPFGNWVAAFTKLKSGALLKAQLYHEESLASAEAARARDGAASPPGPLTPVAAPPLVRTVAAQCRSRRELRKRIVSAVTGRPLPQDAAPQIPRPGAPAAGIVAVSGGHPGRHLPLYGRLLPTSVWILREACKLRDAGEIPRSTTLIATANPACPGRRADARHALEKVQAGAQIIITQPPLAEGSLQEWMSEAKACGLDFERAQRVFATKNKGQEEDQAEKQEGEKPKGESGASTERAAAPSAPSAPRLTTGMADGSAPQGAPLLVLGFPVVSSRRNLDFWLGITGEAASPDAQAVRDAFPDADAGKKGQPVPEAIIEWHKKLLARYLDTPGVAGVHVMALTAASHRIADALVEEGVIKVTASE